MSANEDILEKIERFTRGEMSADESALFEKQMKADKELAKQVEISRIVDQMVVGSEFLKLKDQMTKDLNKSKPYNNTIIFALILLISAGLFFFITPKVNKKAKRPDKVLVKDTKEVILEKRKDTLIKPEIKEEPSVYQKTEIVGKKQSIPVKNKKIEIKEGVADKIITAPKAMIPDTQHHALSEKETQTVRIDSINLIKDPCHNFKPDFEFYTTPSCKGEETGEVHIKQNRIEGGVKPLTFHLGNRVSLANFDKVQAGKYELKVADAANCQVVISNEVWVKEITCKKNLEYIFNPDFDHAWVIPYDESKNPVFFKVLDKRGRPYYQVGVQGKLPSSWSGESNFGLTLDVGLYFFTIEYADKTIDEGTILISR